MNRNLIREHNVFLVKKSFFKEKKLFASDLAHVVGVSNVTIHSILKDLIKEGIILEGESIQRDVGRPSTEYLFNPDYKYALLLTIKEKKPKRDLEIFVQRVNLNGDVRQEETLPFSDFSIDFLRAVIEERIKNWGEIDHIGIMLPGKVHNGVIMESWHDCFNGWNIMQEIEEQLNIPLVAQNDAHVMTIGYAIKNEVPNEETLIGIYYPSQSSPGITIYAKGELIEGSQSLAGEGKQLPGLLGKESPITDRELAERLAGIIPFYNAALAPHRFILHSDTVKNTCLKEVIAQEELLHMQHNKPQLIYIDDFQELITLGLRGLIYKDSPFEL
jgi:predicted transcriptional regulator